MASSEPTTAVVLAALLTIEWFVCDCEPREGQDLDLQLIRGRLEQFGGLAEVHGGLHHRHGVNGEDLVADVKRSASVGRRRMWKMRLIN